MTQEKKNGKIIAIITMIFLFGMISFVTNLAAPMGIVLKNQFDVSNALGMLGNFGNFIAYAVMGIPSGILLQRVGYKKTALIAVAIGFIGVGTTDIAVISLGGTVVSTSIKIAGDDFDEAIVRYMRKKHNLLIGERTAEDIKIKVGSAYPKAEVTTMNVRGRNLVTGLPKTVEVSSEETEEALREATSQIVEAVHSVLEKTPPELASDIADRGIVLTGGGSLLSGLEDLIEAKTGINTMTAEDPMTCVAIGTGKFIEFLAGYRDEVK